ncbi:hypothetical protein C8R44DRAFT_735829 [Mycena epipterygia]|nr:hypothetical protein C8R44DRAFT_735829 [Mycena epipterygia]
MYARIPSIVLVAALLYALLQHQFPPPVGDRTQIHAPARNKPFRAGASHFCKPKISLSTYPDLAKVSKGGLDPRIVAPLAVGDYVTFSGIKTPEGTTTSVTASTNSTLAQLFLAIGTGVNSVAPQTMTKLGKGQFSLDISTKDVEPGCRPSNAGGVIWWTVSFPGFKRTVSIPGFMRSVPWKYAINASNDK